jgi:hypothetical protein
MTRTIEHAREPSALWYPVLYSATRYLHESILHRAEELVNDLARIGFRMGDANVAHSVGAILFSVRWHQGRSVEVLDEMRNLATRFPRVFAWRCALALLSHDAGQTAQAQVELDCLMEERVEERRRDITWVLAMTLLGDLCAESNAAPYARRLYRILTPYENRLAVVGYGVTTWGSVNRVLGRLAILHQDWPLALRHLQAGAALEARFGAKIWLGYSLLEQGKCLFLQGRSSAVSRAAHLAERARSIGEMGGALKLSERAKRLAEEMEPYS